MQIESITRQGKIHGQNALKQAGQKTEGAATGANLAKPSAAGGSGQVPATSRSIPAMISASGLPTDKLSASIISFARFFSLPIKPQLMASIRQQVFAKAGQNPEITAKNREALALAAAAMASKGLELKAAGLENFARGIDPGWKGRQKQKKDNKQNEKNDEKEIKKTDLVSGTFFGEKLIEIMEKEPLYKILNRIPCKNGKRWMVFPFKIEDSGKEFNVSLRILVDTASRSAPHVCNMAIDVSEDNSELGKRWLFLLDETKTKLNVFIQPFCNKIKTLSFIKELSYLLGIPKEGITVKQYIEAFPEEGLDDLLHIVDEKV